jgi:REP element-mobilizing transposase RayT
VPWRLRLCGPDLYHHIYAWGNDRHSIFKEDRHYEYYLQSLKKYSQLFAVDIIAYALMEWHVHLFVYDRDNNISPFMERLHGDYARFYNKDADRVGHVFGERFNNKIVQPNNYALRLSKYIHLQAVEAGLVDHPMQYLWTSYRIYCGLEKNSFVKPGIILDQLSNEVDRGKQYASMVMDVEEDPVDWERARLYVVGDRGFKRYINDTYKKSKRKRKPSTMDPIHLACDEFKITKKMLLYPRGQKERKIRHRVILSLINDQGFNQTQIASALRISRLAVMNVLRKGKVDE